MWKRYTDNEIMKITSSSGTYKAIYNNGSCLSLFGKDNDKVLKFDMNDCSYIEISVFFF